MPRRPFSISSGICKDDPSPLGTLRGVFDEVRETVLPGADGSERKMQELENLDGLVREIGEFLGDRERKRSKIRSET